MEFSVGTSQLRKPESFGLAEHFVYKYHSRFELLVGDIRCRTKTEHGSSCVDEYSASTEILHELHGVWCSNGHKAGTSLVRHLDDVGSLRMDIESTEGALEKRRLMLADLSQPRGNEAQLLMKPKDRSGAVM